MSTLVTPDAPAPPVAPPSPHPTVRRGSHLAGVGVLVHLALRRDRLRIALWGIGLVSLTAVTTNSVRDLYGTPEELARYAALVDDNAPMIVQAGPGYGLDDPTIGAVIMNELSLWTYIAIAVMCFFAVVRHTRTEEALARTEMVRAAPVGRSAGTAAALIAAALTSALIGLGTAAAFVQGGLAVGGAVAFAASMFGIGMVFAGVGAVAAQLTENPRSALGLSGAVLAASFVVRAVGDVQGSGLSWASPLGWAQAIRAFADERWWVLALPAIATLALVRVAFALQAHRDYGGGIFTPRGGPPTASSWLGSPRGLAARLQRASVVGWAVGAGLFAFFYGVVADQAETILESYPEMEDYLLGSGDASITDLFLTQSIVTMALIASGFAVASTLRLRSEEFAHRADPILATPTSRAEWASSHLLMTVLGSSAILVVVGASTGLGYAVASGEFDSILELAVAGLAVVPAVLVVAGVTLALYGLLPRFAPAAWGVYAAVLFVGVFGELLSLPRSVLNLSPFEHLTVPPAEAFDVVPSLLLLVIAALFGAVGLAGLRRRDMG